MVRIKRVFAVGMLLAILSGCSSASPQATSGLSKRYQATFLNLFDTVTTIVGYAQSEEAFQSVAQDIHDELEQYHQLYDIYNEYPGMNNLKIVNDRAAQEPVEVDARIIQLLEFSKELYQETGGTVNVAMGSVLSLWHETREAGIANPDQAALPEEEALKTAAEHTDLSSVEVNRERGTVFFTDALVKLDVGAIAKGYALEQVCQNAPEGLLISVGGNVRATGPKPTDGQPWVVGIQHPDNPEEYLHTVYVQELSVVTSGDYQRYYTVDGVEYHHIIDPATGYPARLWQSVTVLCEDSGLADGLSTALFLLPQPQGQALLDRFGAEAVWVSLDGETQYSSGFEAYIRT